MVAGNVMEMKSAKDIAKEEKAEVKAKTVLDKNGMRNVMTEDHEARTLMNGTYHGRTASGWVGARIVGYATKSLQMGGIPQPPEKTYLSWGGGPPDAQVYCYVGCEFLL